MISSERRKVMMSSSREPTPERSPAAPRVAASGSQSQPLVMAHHKRPNGAARAANKKVVQVVYYLCRNGQLEQPHFLELSLLLPNQQLRLRDVVERLTILRGRGMSSLFSWSYKRSYRNGYVWNDLSGDDVIYPTDGEEYVLKGSEILISGGSSQRFVADKVVKTESLRYDEYGGAVGVTATAPAVMRDSGGSTTKPHRQTELALEFNTSPPSSSSSDKQAEADPSPTRPGSMLLQLIACGSVAGGKGRPAAPALVPRVISESVAAPAHKHDPDSLQVRSADRRRRMRVVVEDKEYFSGSIVEGGGGTAPPGLALKKSNSYNEERSSRLKIGEESYREVVDNDDEQIEAGGLRAGRCIPAGRKKSTSKQ